MSNLTVIVPYMHKVAEVDVDVKCQCNANASEYVSVEFEIFRDGEGFKAIPLPNADSKKLAKLPKQLFFQPDGKPLTFEHEIEDVTEDIINQLGKINIIEARPKKCSGKKETTSSCCMDLA